MPDDPRTLIQALAEHEEAMGVLYAAYAQEYPEVADLWTALAHDEQGHGALLRSLADEDADLATFARNRRYDLTDIRADTARLTNLARLAPVAGFPLQEAFHVAIKLEDSLIESEVFVSYEGDPPEVAVVVDALREQTELHQRRLSERFKEIGV